METKQLKFYKVFLASSNELSADRDHFCLFINKMNRVLERFGYHIQVERWENVDNALPDNRSQDEYNKNLQDCDECIVLFWRKVGKYSKKELELAYQERYGNGKLSRLVIYFKDVKEGDITDDLEKDYNKLLEEKKGFAKKYGERFFAQTPNIDCVEANFLLFFIEKNVPYVKLTVKDSNIVLDGEKLGIISNLSFAYYNKPYRELSKKVSDLEKDLVFLKTTNPDSSSIPLLRKELAEKKKELQKFENDMMEMAQTITRITTADPDNERVALAQKEFEEGNYYNALNMLNREEILAEAAQCNKDFETAQALADKAKEKYRAKIETIVLRIQYLSVARFNNWFSECVELYGKAVFHARKCYSDAELADLLFDYAYFLQNYNQSVDSILIIYKEALGIYCKLSKSSLYMSEVATTLDNMGTLHKIVGNYTDAELEYKKALENRRKLAESSPETYLTEVASTLNNLGNLYRITHKYDESERHYREAIGIRLRLAKSNPAEYMKVATTLNNLGLLFNDEKKHAEAEKEYKRALEFFSGMDESNPEVYIPDMAMVLNNLGNVYIVKNKLKEAEEKFEDALGKYRQLAKGYPEVYNPDVAMTLFNFALLKYGQGQLTEAAQMAHESLEKYQTMAKLSPDAFNKKVENAKKLLEEIRAKQAEKE